MKKKVIIIIGVLLLVGIVGYLYYTFVQQKEEVVRAASSATVQITADGFVPETVIIKQGQSVEWINVDTRPHQIAPDPHPIHSSHPGLAGTDPLQAREYMSFRFDQKGKFTYHDEINPLKSKGVIIIE